jgi:hypothetical protein
MGFLKKLFNLEDIEVSGQLQVGSFKQRFEESFGTQVKVYKPKADGTLNTGKGARPADAKSTLASNCAAGMKVQSLTIKKTKTVGEIETEFAEKMGIGIQIMLPDGSGFAPNEMKLTEIAKLAS